MDGAMILNDEAECCSLSSNLKPALNSTRELSPLEGSNPSFTIGFFKMQERIVFSVIVDCWHNRFQELPAVSSGENLGFVFKCKMRNLFPHLWECLVIQPIFYFINQY